jgi:hypothetical protein
MKPTATFKLSKSTKRSLATIIDPVQRSAFKRAMIDAELTSRIQVKPAKRTGNQ